MCVKVAQITAYQPRFTRFQGDTNVDTRTRKTQPPLLGFHYYALHHPFIAPLNSYGPDHDNRFISSGHAFFNGFFTGRKPNSILPARGDKNPSPLADWVSQSSCMSEKHKRCRFSVHPTTSLAVAPRECPPLLIQKTPFFSTHGDRNQDTCSHLKHININANFFCIFLFPDNGGDCIESREGY